MHFSFPFSSRGRPRSVRPWPPGADRALTAIGTGALLVLVIVLITGGFVVNAGLLHLSVRSPTPAAVIAVLSWMALAFGNRADLAESAATTLAFVERHAAAVAMTLAAAAAGPTSYPWRSRSPQCVPPARRADSRRSPPGSRYHSSSCC